MTSETIQLRFDLSPAQLEGAIREHLIRLGWTPPNKNHRQEREKVIIPDVSFAPDWLSVPGFVIADVLKDRGWTQAELAQKLGYTEEHVSQIINGKVAITKDIASQLMRVLGSATEFLVRKEMAYRQRLERQQPDWEKAPSDATHYQPHQDTFYKRVSASEWYVWSRKNICEPMQWFPSPGTNDGAEWIMRPIETQPAEDKAAWRVPVRESSFGEWLDHGIHDALVLVVYRDTHGWKAAGLGNVLLAHQVYVKNIEPLCVSSYEIAVVGLFGGGWRTVWARSDDDVTHPVPSPEQPDAGLDMETVLRWFLTEDGYIAECDIPHIVAALTAQLATAPVAVQSKPPATVETDEMVEELRDALQELISWIPSADVYRRMGFDPEAPMRAFRKANALLSKGSRNG